jgi:hypothetical protein
MTMANLLRRWSGPDLPKRLRFGICAVCEKIQITYNQKEPRFHWACHQKWESTPAGRHFQSQRKRGLEAKPDLRKPAPGRPKKEEKLRLHHSWAIQYCAGKSFDKIAERQTPPLTPRGIANAIENYVSQLPPPHLVAERLQSTVRCLVETWSSHKKGIPAYNRPNGQ